MEKKNNINLKTYNYFVQCVRMMKFGAAATCRFPAGSLWLGAKGFNFPDTSLVLLHKINKNNLPIRGAENVVPVHVHIHCAFRYVVIHPNDFFLRNLQILLRCFGLNLFGIWICSLSFKLPHKWKSDGEKSGESAVPILRLVITSRNTAMTRENRLRC
jgi:hypothetical protein